LAGDLAALTLVVAVLIWFWNERILRPALGITFAGSDVFTYFVPVYSAIRDALRAADLPLWNPYQSCGTPLHGILQGGAFYPARLLLLVFSPSAALGWSTFLHLAIASIGIFMLSRTLGFTIAGSLAASIGFTYGFAVPAIYAPAAYLEPGVWCPIAALAMLRFVQTQRWRYVLLMSFAICAPVLAGGYQIAVYSLYAMALFGLGLLLDRRTRALTLTSTSVIGLAGGAMLAVAVSSIQWLPTLLWSQGTVRSTQALSAAQIDPWNAPPGNVASMLIVRRSVITALMVPPPLAALALVGLLFGSRVILPLAIGGVTALLLSLGPHTPWFRLYYLLPGFSMFRLPARLHYLVVLAAALAAAAGLDVLQRWARAPGRFRLVLATLVFAVGVVATYRAMPAEVGPRGTTLPNPTEPDVLDLVSAVTT